MFGREKHFFIAIAVACVLLAQAAKATPPFVELKEKFCIGPVNSAQEAEKHLARNKRHLTDALANVDISDFTNGSMYLKQHNDAHNSRHFKFYFDRAEIKEIQPTDKSPFRYAKYYFPTGDLYYQLRIPFVPESPTKPEVLVDKPINEQTIPIVCLFISKNGHVIAFW